MKSRKNLIFPIFSKNGPRYFGNRSTFWYSDFAGWFLKSARCHLIFIFDFGWAKVSWRPNFRFPYLNNREIGFTFVSGRHDSFVKMCCGELVPHVESLLPTKFGTPITKIDGVINDFAFCDFWSFRTWKLQSRFQTISLKIGFKPSEGFETTPAVWGKVPGFI